MALRRLVLKQICQIPRIFIGDLGLKARKCGRFLNVGNYAIRLLMLAAFSNGSTRRRSYRKSSHSNRDNPDILFAP